MEIKLTIDCGERIAGLVGRVLGHMAEQSDRLDDLYSRFDLLVDKIDQLTAEPEQPQKPKVLS